LDNSAIFSYATRKYHIRFYFEFFHHLSHFGGYGVMQPGHDIFNWNIVAEITGDFLPDKKRCKDYS